MDGDSEADFEREVLRINQRFLLEVVEGHNVCPYARMARIQQRVSRLVLQQRDADIDAAVAAVERVEAGPASIEIGLLIFPRIELTAREFEHFNADVRRKLDARRRGPNAFVHAAFHPDFPCDQRTPEALVSFFRRSPDPTIQLVRWSTLQDVKGARNGGTIVFDPATMDLSQLDTLLQPSITDRITRDNFDRVARLSPAVFESIYQNIREDRARSYARFGVHT